MKIPDINEIFILDTDASEIAISGILQQYDDNNNLKVIAYSSKKLNENERNWTVREIEAYAIVWNIMHFAEYLKLCPLFFVRTDHQSLQWIWSTKLNKRITRWALLLQEFNFVIKYRQGKLNANADIISRDVKDEGMDEGTLDRISVQANVFKVSVNNIINNSDKDDIYFPGILDFMTEYKKEEDIIKGLKLHKEGNLYVNQHNKIYVPCRLRKAILYYYHYSKIGNHQGITRTFNRIRKQFYWPELRRSIEKYSNDCIICIRRRKNKNVPLHGNMLVNKPLCVIAIDLFGPFTYGSEQYTLLTVIDHFTKYAIVIVLKENEADSENIWMQLYTNWFSRFGIPIGIISDNGPQFSSIKFKENCAELGIKKWYSTPFHPQGNAVIEAFHQILKQGLMTYVRLENVNIYLDVANILMTYNSTPHPSVGDTPYYILTGMDMILPNMQEWNRQEYEEWKEKNKVIQNIRYEIFNNMLIKYINNIKIVIDKQKLEINDLVVYELNHKELNEINKQQFSAKFTICWSELYRIRSFSNKDKTVITISSIWNDSIIKKIHISQVRKIPREYGIRELNKAKYELLADIKKDMNINNKRLYLDELFHYVRNDEKKEKFLESITDDNEVIIDEWFKEDTQM